MRTPPCTLGMARCVLCTLSVGLPPSNDLWPQEEAACWGWEMPVVPKGDKVCEVVGMVSW